MMNLSHADKISDKIWKAFDIFIKAGLVKDKDKLASFIINFLLDKILKLNVKLLMFLYLILKKYRIKIVIIIIDKNNISCILNNDPSENTLEKN